MRVVIRKLAARSSLFPFIHFTIAFNPVIQPARLGHLMLRLVGSTRLFSLWRRTSPHRNLIAGQGLPFETLCIASCLTTVVVVTGGLAVGHGVFERDPGDLERLQECRCRVAEHLVGVLAAA